MINRDDGWGLIGPSLSSDALFCNISAFTSRPGGVGCLRLISLGAPRRMDGLSDEPHPGAVSRHPYEGRLWRNPNGSDPSRRRIAQRVGPGWPVVAGEVEQFGQT